ncbi:PucR family transcriptional regulator [Antrihabitans stalactiti]|nr:helix-turn-helix domain-containing protein [Antrihabitans stalactiti]
MPNNEVAQWISRYVVETDNRTSIERLTLMVDEMILAVVPSLASDETMRAELHASTRAHWRGFYLALGRESFEPNPPAEALEWARTVARRGLDLGVLLKSYRIGQRALWEYLTRLLDDEIVDVELRSAVLREIWDRAAVWLDAAIEQVVITYSDEREQWRRGALARRVATVRSILRGDVIDVDHAAGELGHTLHLHQTAFVLWADDTTPDAAVTPALESLATHLARAVDGAPPLTMTSGARGLWVWVATTTSRYHDVYAEVQPSAAGIHIAAGSTGLGLKGFRRSHREALAAQRVAIESHSTAALTRYSDIELVCLVSGDGSLDMMRTLVERELRGLAGPDESNKRLRETALVFLTNGGDAAAAAATLALHPNTVRYRIRQAEQQMGHTIDERRAHVEIALRCAQTYSDFVLPDDR